MLVHEEFPILNYASCVYFTQFAGGSRAAQEEQKLPRIKFIEYSTTPLIQNECAATPQIWRPQIGRPKIGRPQFGKH